MHTVHAQLGCRFSIHVLEYAAGRLESLCHFAFYDLRESFLFLWDMPHQDPDLVRVNGFGRGGGSLAMSSLEFHSHSQAVAMWSGNETILLFGDWTKHALSST